MRHPVQQLHYCTSTQILFVALGGTLQCFGPTGTLTTTWIAPQAPVRVTKKEKRAQGEKEKKDAKEKKDDTAAEETAVMTALEETKEAEASSPSKKRKVSSADTTEEPAWVRTSMLGVGAPRADGEGTGNSITRMLTVRDGHYLIVLTNEDKMLRVFEVSDEGLKVLSERAMPKRLYALAVADSESTILVADKFGDVYALPLLPTPEELASISTPTPDTAPKTAAQLEKVERDRLAEEKRKRTEIALDLPFTHTLLLGHVSMLVDIVSATVPSPDAGRPDRTYVLTADRDEHIRVSRYPQGYVIDGFCLGHESFVSKLLVPSWDRDTLFSGGGDDFLVRWEWRSGKLLQKVLVGGLVEGVVGRKATGGKVDQHDNSEAADKEFKVTIVALREVPSLRQVLVAFESVPALFVFTHDAESKTLTHTSTHSLSGHPLDIAVNTAAPSLWISVVPGTVDGPTLEHFVYTGSEWSSSTEGLAAISTETDKVQFTGDEKALNEGLLYATGLLRKGTGRMERDE